MLDHCARAVERKGCRVELTFCVGMFVGQPHVYEFRTTRQAAAFEKFAKGVDEKGMPVAIPEVYHGFRKD